MVADDIDIVVLLLHICCQGDISSSVMIVSPIQGQAVIDINAAVEWHRMVIPDLLAAHGITYFVIGKTGVLKAVLRSGRYSLSMRDCICLLSEITSQAKRFILPYYGQSRSQTVTEAQQKIWASKVGCSLTGAPKLASLPPTNDAFQRMFPELIFR